MSTVAATDRSLRASIDRAVLAHRIVQLSLLLGLVWKWKYFIASADVYLTIPLEDPFFPAILQSAKVVIAAFLMTVVAIGLNLLTASRWLQETCCVVALAGSTVLCVHQASYNDMTFVTTWWTLLWSTWFVWHLEDVDQQALLRRSAFLSRLIVSVILLGGGVGKWTSEYWSGDVFFDIYFRDRDFWVFNLLRENYDVNSLHQIAKWYSRQVIIIETGAGLGLWLLPPRIAAFVGVVLLASIGLFANFFLFSVLMSLIGLASVGFFVKRSA